MTRTDVALNFDKADILEFLLTVELEAPHLFQMLLMVQMLQVLLMCSPGTATQRHWIPLLMLGSRAFPKAGRRAKLETGRQNFGFNQR